VNLKFLFMDESHHDPSRITTLTGLLIPSDVYPSIRDEFYDILITTLLPKSEKEIGLGQLPELHANELLNNFPDSSDEMRFRLLNKLVQLVASQNIHIYRYGVFMNKASKQSIATYGPQFLISICWFNLIAMLESELAENMIIPVMDGFDPKMVGSFAYAIKSLDSIRRFVDAKNLFLQHTENILGEVFYADSQYSIFIQLADIISYLRLTNDLVTRGTNLTEYKNSLHEISKQIPANLLHEATQEFNFEELRTKD
jgi:hypothetical protein